jgi:hypothetical protein
VKSLKKNVGDFDAYLRLVAGFSMLGYGVLKRSKTTVFLGSMKIAEGLTRFCPMLAIMGISTSSDNVVAECCCETPDKDVQ